MTTERSRGCSPGVCPNCPWQETGEYNKYVHDRHLPCGCKDEELPPGTGNGVGGSSVLFRLPTVGRGFCPRKPWQRRRREMTGRKGCARSQTFVTQDGDNYYVSLSRVEVPRGSRSVRNRLIGSGVGSLRIVFGKRSFWYSLLTYVPVSTILCLHSSPTDPPVSGVVNGTSIPF